MKKFLILLLPVFLIEGCYSGPGMGKVMRETCDSISKFSYYFECVKDNWHREVVSAGYGDNSNVQYAMEAGRHLKEGVENGLISDYEAKYKWRSVQMDLDKQERAQKAALAQAMSQAFINYGNSLQQTYQPSVTSTGSSYLNCRTTGNTTRCSDGTSYRQIGNTLRGSDGTYCRRTGQTVRCY